MLFAMKLLENLAQLRGIYVVMMCAADGKVRPLLAFVKAKASADVDAVRQGVVFKVRLECTEVLSVAAREAGAAQTDHHLALGLVRHSAPPEDVQTRESLGMA